MPRRSAPTGAPRRASSAARTSTRRCCARAVLDDGQLGLGDAELLGESPRVEGDAARVPLRLGVAVVEGGVKGKCTWWREFPNEEDRFNRSLKADERRVQCICFVEGDTWEYETRDVPADCPFSRRCRYHIRVG